MQLHEANTRSTCTLQCCVAVWYSAGQQRRGPELFSSGCVEKMAAVCDCGVFVSAPKAAYIFGLALACMPDATVAATSCIAAALVCLRHLSTAPIFHLQARLPSTQVREDAQRPAAGTSSWLGKLESHTRSACALQCCVEAWNAIC